LTFVVNLDVDDLGKAIAFYCSAFDLKVGRRFGTFGVELVGSSTSIYLLAKAAGTTPADTTSQRRCYERHWTPIHLDFIVDDIEVAIAKAVAAGARLERPAATHKWGKLALMADPFGHGFCFVQFVGRGYDEIAD
jgi:predicted enzyme related to lactoylglutathione lyase